MMVPVPLAAQFSISDWNLEIINDSLKSETVYQDSITGEKKIFLIVWSYEN